MRLSICIPTYNRERFLRLLIDAIIAQASPDEVEIAISDNASTDGTAALVEEARRRFPSIVYSRWETNMGADRNYRRAVEIASGEYCWLMGSDDIIPEGGIAKVLAKLPQGTDILLFSRMEASFSMQPLQVRHWLDLPRERRFDLSQPGELDAYFRHCQGLGGLFSYLSSIVVRRQSWNSVRYDESFDGTLYSHVYILLALMMQGRTLLHVPEVVVWSRGGNDSFLITDWIDRALVDLKGYKRLGDALIPDAELRQAFWDVMQRQHTPVNVIKMKAMSGWKSWGTYKDLATRTFRMPVWVLRAAELAYPLARTAFLLKSALRRGSHG